MPDRVRVPAPVFASPPSPDSTPERVALLPLVLTVAVAPVFSVIAFDVVSVELTSSVPLPKLNAPVPLMPLVPPTEKVPPSRLKVPVPEPKER